jgi:hypothetical protein
MKFFSNLYNSSWENRLLEDARKNGAFEGKNGRPSPESTAPDENENKYHSKALELIIKANNELTKQIRSLLPKIADERHKLAEAKAECSHRQNLETIKSEIISSRDEYRQELHKSQLKLISTEGHLNSFKTINQVNHEPDHPHDIPHYLSVVFLIMIVEALLNSFFWSKGSGHGLAGGYLMAVVLAIANIALAILTGLGFRHINLQGNNQKSIAFGSAILGTISILWLNFYIATTRNSIVTQLNTDNKVKLLFQETESTVLFILGIVFAAYAAYKGFRLLGSIPGYRKVHDDYESAFATIKDIESKIKNSIKNTADTALNKLANVNGKISQAKQKGSALSGEIKVLEKDFHAVTKQVELSLGQIIQKYRATNSASRPQGIEAPTYFSEQVSLDIEPTEELGHLIHDCHELNQEVEVISSELTDIIKSETIEINQIKSESIGQLLTDYFDAIKEDARKQYISLIPK